MSTGRVEVSQQGSIPLLACLALLLCVGSLRLDVVGDDQLVGLLGATVGVGRAKWAVFRDRDHVRKASGVAVDGGRGGEDDVGDIMLGHGAQQADGAVDINAVVFERNFARLADGLRPSVSIIDSMRTLYMRLTFRAAK